MADRNPASFAYAEADRLLQDTLANWCVRGSVQYFGYTPWRLWARIWVRGIGEGESNDCILIDSDFNQPVIEEVAARLAKKYNVEATGHYLRIRIPEHHLDLLPVEKEEPASAYLVRVYYDPKENGEATEIGKVARWPDGTWTAFSYRHRPGTLRLPQQFATPEEGAIWLKQTGYLA